MADDARAAGVPRTGVMAIARRPEPDPAGLLARAGPARSCCSRTRATPATSAPACEWRPPRTPPACSRPACTTPGTRTPCAARRVCTSRCRCARWRPPPRRATGRWSRSTPRRAARPGGLPALDARLRHRARRPQRGLLARADARVALPMRAGVSSLNLATSVAAVLFSLRHADQIDDEDQRLVRPDHPAGAALAVGQHRRDRDPPPAADLHAGHALVPARDHLALAEPELERVAAVPRGVELLAGDHETPT